MSRTDTCGRFRRTKSRNGWGGESRIEISKKKCNYLPPQKKTKKIFDITVCLAKVSFLSFAPIFQPPPPRSVYMLNYIPD